MSVTLIFAIICMVLALTNYSLGVWGEYLSGTLARRHVVFFWIGFVFDTIGTTLMGRISGGFTFNMHATLGALAIILMLVHAVWATVILVKGNAESASNFHRFSIFVWGMWLIPFVSGMILAMTRA